MYVLGGIVERIPVQAIVRTFTFSPVPTVTITGGRGAVRAPALKLFLAIITSKMPMCRRLFPFYPSENDPKKRIGSGKILPDPIVAHITKKVNS